MQIFSTYIIELAVISALVSLFLDFCFREGNIFEGWLEFLYEHSVPGKVRQQMANKEREDRFEKITWFWFKPLGGCVVCMNVWISFALCLAFFREWEFIVVVLLSSLIVRFFQEKIV